jgi:uncharacterized membrane protein
MRSKNGANKKIKWTRGELAVRWGMIGIVLSLAVFALWFSVAEEHGRDELKAGTDLSLRLADLKPGKLFLFTYRLSSSTKTQLAVQRGDDGVIRVAFAACRACWRSDHYEWFGKVVCSRCGHTISLPDPGKTTDEKRSCSSVAVVYSIEGGQLTVRGQDIEDVFQRWYLPDAQKG